MGQTLENIIFDFKKKQLLRWLRFCSSIRQLDAGDLEVVLTVGLFNEGTDIPRVDTLLFVRPTESLTVFTQQVWRGLRLAEGKSHSVLYMLERGEAHWMDPITPGEIARFFHKYLTEKEYRKRKDFSDKGKLALWEWNEKTATRIEKLIIDMPMSMWSGAKGSMTRFEDGLFSLNVQVKDAADKALLYRWTREMCQYRLHAYFERGEW